MGKPGPYGSLVPECIRYESEPGELKHLSSQRKRKQNAIPSVAASEIGRVDAVMQTVWEDGPKKVTVL